MREGNIANGVQWCGISFIQQRTKFTGERSLPGCTKHKTCFLLGIIICFNRKWSRLKGKGKQSTQYNNFLILLLSTALTLTLA